MASRTPLKVVAFAATLIAVAIAARLTIAEIYRVPSSSMAPTLQPGDQVVVVRFHRGASPRRGEVIVFEDAEGRAWIKRVIGLPGDSVGIDGARVAVNGSTLDEPWARVGDSQERTTHLVPAEHFFVLGDNRANSDDSRAWGFVDRESLRGRARLICWSRAEGGAIRWNRILSRID